MRTFWLHLRRALRTTLVRCVFPAQAVAFTSFLTFFPLLLLVISVLTLVQGSERALEELLGRVRSIIPPGSRQMVIQYLLGRGEAPWKWIVTGAIGTVLVGMQVMSGLMQGFRIAHRDTADQPFWPGQLRALFMLLISLGPWVALSVLLVFGKQMKQWLANQFGLPGLFYWLGVIVYSGLILLAGFLTLSVIYRLGRPAYKSWHEVWPGASLSTLLLWGVHTGFGVYVRHVPYQYVYGGLAAVIGLLVWMYLSALVVLIGSAYNAEMAATGKDWQR